MSNPMIHCGILVHEQGKIVDVNPFVVRLVGYQRSEFIGQDIAIFLPAEPIDRVAQKIASQVGSFYQTVAIRKDGVAVKVEVQTLDILRDHETLSVLVIRDLSQKDYLNTYIPQVLAENYCIFDG